MDDRELDVLRGISCAAVLERLPPPWRLDRRESTRRALKYRRGAGEIVIVNHDGHGWWDPCGTAKGDVFDLVQHFEPGLNFGEVRQVLRPFVGLAPAFPEMEGQRKGSRTLLPPATRWTTRATLSRGGAAWRYLADKRALPDAVLQAAAMSDAVRDGAYGNAWFAHRDAAGAVSHVEIRGPAYRGALTGGNKTLFRLSRGTAPIRLVVAEAPIDALSLAALEGLRTGALYLATGGGIGPRTEIALDALVATLRGVPDAVLLAATDADAGGDLLAGRVVDLVAGRIDARRLRPIGLKDWNDVLRHGRG